MANFLSLEVLHISPLFLFTFLPFCYIVYILLHINPLLFVIPIFILSGFNLFLHSYLHLYMLINQLYYNLLLKIFNFLFSRFSYTVN